MQFHRRIIWEYIAIWYDFKISFDFDCTVGVIFVDIDILVGHNSVFRAIRSFWDIFQRFNSANILLIQNAYDCRLPYSEFKKTTDSVSNQCESVCVVLKQFCDNYNKCQTHTNKTLARKQNYIDALIQMNKSVRWSGDWTWHICYTKPFCMFCFNVCIYRCVELDDFQRQQHTHLHNSYGVLFSNHYF